MKYKQAVLRKTLTGDWEEFSFTNLSRHFKVKNLSDSDILVSFEKDDVDEDQCFKIASGYIETVQISDKDQNRNSFVVNNNEDIFSSNVIYVKGTGDVEVCALEGFELITANQVAITVTAENCTYSGDTTLMQGGMATITFVNAEGYNLPETITVTGAGHNWNQATGIATLFNLSSPSSVAVTCVCEQNLPVFSPLAVGDDISGGATIYVDTSISIDDVIQAIIQSVGGSRPYRIISSANQYPYFEVTKDEDTMQDGLYYAYSATGRQMIFTKYFATGTFNPNIQADGSLVLAGSVPGTISQLYGDGWNGVALGLMKATTA